MIEIATTLRTAIINALSPLVVDGVTIPIFDELVNPNTPLPTLKGGQAYILIRDQQEVETELCKTGFRQNALITLDCIVKYPANVGSKASVELISTAILPLIDRFISLSGWTVLNVTKVNSQSLVEQGLTESAYRKLITFSFDVVQG
jgi:hypothetical protein